jgi:hypothetical protein
MILCVLCVLCGLRVDALIAQPVEMPQQVVADPTSHRGSSNF